MFNLLQWTNEEVKVKRERGELVWEEAVEKLKDYCVKDTMYKISISEYAREFKDIILQVEKIQDYLDPSKPKINNELHRNARFRLGAKNLSVRYWAPERERRCRICGLEEETLTHVIERCEITKVEGERWFNILKGDKRNLAKLNTIIWKRKKEERRKEEDG